jgi:hypothetical protein
MLMTESEFHNKRQALVEISLDNYSPESPEQDRFTIVSQNKRSLLISDKSATINK